MNRTPLRGRLLRRTAVTTTAVVAAAILGSPGTGAAQDAESCPDAGTSPMADGIAAALDLAEACGIEVRVQSRSGPYETVYATPEGQIHLTATSGAVQEYQDSGVPDPTLALASGTLAPIESSTPFTLRYDNADAPLVATAHSKLHWSGAVPVPSYSGSTAVYDELAAGLDLTVDVGASSAGLRFDLEDADAWDALDTGLAVSGLGASRGSLYGSVLLDDYSRAQNWSTPLTVRDAEGTVTPVTVVRNADFTLTLTIPESVLESAVYPLTVSTQWTQRNRAVNDWGAVTSASPNLNLLRGEGGLDTPYFEAGGATGDAVVGPYCDTVVDPECDATAQAASYWNFWSPLLANNGDKPSTSYSFRFLPTSASFRVDAAEGTDCVAPELRRTGVYTPSTLWADHPSGASSVPVAGACVEGAAVYDVSQAVPGIAEYYMDGPPFTFGMPASAETARFDGESARLDVYYDIVGYSYYEPDFRLCSEDPRYLPWDDSTPRYGGFLFNAWEADRFDYGFTWTATFTDGETGATVLTTDPVPVQYGSRATAVLSADQALEDGWYEIRYQFTSAATGFSYTSSDCYIGVDTEKPEFVDITVPPGPHFVGDIVPVEVTVADAGFPNGAGELTIFCLGDDDCEPEEVVLTDKTSVTFDLEITKDGTTAWMLQMFDEAGFMTYSEEIHVAASYNRSDYNGDDHQDLFSVRKSDGQLMFYAGKGTGSFAGGVTLGAGWGKMDVVMAGDLTGDGKPDLLARDTKTGNLYTYPGNGSGGFGARITAGSGWNSLGVFTSNGDFNGDGKTDLYAVGKTDGKLYFYPGKGNGTFGTRTAVGSGWGVMDTISTIADFNLDGKPDLLADNHVEGEYFVYYGQGGGKVGSPERISDSFEEGSLSTAQYNEIFAAGDYDENGTKEVVSIDALTGNLVTHSFDELGNPVYPPRVVDDGWGGYSLPGITVDRTYDFNASATTDLVARHGSTGTVYVYTGNGSGGFGTRIGWGTSMSNMNLLETAGDFTGDGIPDLLARVASTGSLYVMPGTGDGEFYYGGRIRVGTGWNSMSAIVSGQDFNGDGKIDIVAREKSTGYLWLYPGKGDGHVGTRVKIGSGWNAMRDITAAGDLDHDGHADVIAVKAADNCMYFYGGRGDGTLKPGVKTSCNWVGYDSVASVGDFNGDGHADWVSRRKSDGALYLYKGNGVGGYSSRALIGTGWNSMNIIA